MRVERLNDAIWVVSSYLEPLYIAYSLRLKKHREQREPRVQELLSQIIVPQFD